MRDYQVETWCTPGRAALMTGRMPIRSGTTRSETLVGPNAYGLDPREVILPQILKRVGYQTALFGKWHLGYAPERQPQARGFDEFYGILGSSKPIDPAIPGFDDVSPALQMIVSGHAGEQLEEVDKMTYERRASFDTELTEKAIDFVKRKVSEQTPFFVMLSYVNMHQPVIPHPDFAGRSGGGAYTDALMEIDHNVGTMLDTLKSLSIERNTVIIFTADNGATRRAPDPEQNADPGPWSGDLGTTWEGGLRSAGIMRWPGRIRSDWVCDEMVHMMDLFPTLASFCGGAVPIDRPIDGIDQSDFFLGKEQESRRVSRMLHVEEELAAIRYKQFKVHYMTIPRHKGMLSPFAKPGLPELYNLRTDPKELSNIASRSGGLPIAAAIRSLVLKPYRDSLEAFPNLDYTKFKRED